MSDNKLKKDGRDAVRIDIQDPSELQYIAELYKVSVNEVRLAIQKAGTNRRDEVYRMLESRPT